MVEQIGRFPANVRPQWFPYTFSVQLKIVSRVYNINVWRHDVKYQRTERVFEELWKELPITIVFIGRARRHLCFDRRSWVKQLLHMAILKFAVVKNIFFMQSGFQQ